MLSVGRYATRDLPHATAFYDQIAASLRGPEGAKACDVAYFRDLDGNKLVISCFGSLDV